MIYFSFYWKTLLSNHLLVAMALPSLGFPIALMSIYQYVNPSDIQ